MNINLFGVCISFFIHFFVLLVFFRRVYENVYVAF